MRILFAPNPHVRLDRPWTAPYVPLELLSAMAVAERAGASAALFDVNRLVDHGRLPVAAEMWPAAARLLLEAEPDLVLLETWTGTLHSTLLLAEAIRRVAPGLPLVLAGAGTSAMAVEVLARFPRFVDGVIRGELEPAVAELARERRPTLPAAPGLVRRDTSGAPVDAALAWVPDLDALPRPAYHLALLRPGDTVPVEPGRGCEQGCTFCALAGHWPPRYRPRRPDALAAEMIALAARYPGSSLDLTQDPVFFNLPERVAALCAALHGDGARWSCHARVDRLGPAQLEAMARAGCRGILFGVESGCPEMQRRIGKGIALEHLEPTVRHAADLGIDVRVSFVVGLPGEDAASLTRTMEALLRAREAGAADTPVQPLRAYPGSPAHRDCSAALVYEPLLATAAADDQAAQALIAGHPDLLSASYRVDLPGLPRSLLVGSWLGLSALADVLLGLRRHGASLAALAGALELDPVPGDLEAAVEQLAGHLEALAADSSALLDSAALRDQLRYKVAQFAVSLEPTADGEPPDEEALARILARTARARPVALASWRLLELTTDIERIVDGLLSPADHTERQWVLVAKVGAPSDEASYYTRRSFAVETFLLDEVGAALLPLCDGATDLETLGHTVALRLRRPPAATVEACCESVAELVRGGVLGLL